MENYNSSEQRQQINPLLLGFIVVQVIVIIIVLALFLGKSDDDKIPEGDIAAQPHVEVSNYEVVSSSDVDPDSDSPQLPESSHVAIEYAVTEMMKNNLTEVDTKTTVEFRAGSVQTKTFSRQKLNYFTAIIDLPEQEQSYRVFYEYSDDENNPYLSPNDQTIILCLDDNDEKKYPGFDCRDIYGPKTRSAIVNNYINYFGFEYFSAYIELNKPDTVIISPSVTYENSEATKKKYIKEVKEAIEQLGISPNNFKYYVRTAADVNYEN